MATGASTAYLAIMLVDGRKGILPQTRRHSHIASLLGIRHIILAVNKIDLIGHDQKAFEAIVCEYMDFAAGLAFANIQPIPISARFGDSIAGPSQKTPWYAGPSLIEHLEAVSIADDDADKPFRFPVQYINRPNLDFRGACGQVASGSVRVGDSVVVAKSGLASTVKEILTFDGLLARAVEGQAITIVLEDQLDVSRGDMLVAAGERPTVADQFQVHVIWFDAAPMIPGRSYVLRTEADSTSATTLKYRVGIDTFFQVAAKVLAMNEIGVCNLSTQVPIAFDPYWQNRVTGNFILIDRSTDRPIAPSARACLTLDCTAPRMSIGKPSRWIVEHALRLCARSRRSFGSPTFLAPVSRRLPTGCTAACPGHAHIPPGRGQCAPRA